MFESIPDPLFQVQSYLPLSIVSYGVSKHYVGSKVSDRRPLGYLLYEVAEAGDTTCSSMILHVVVIVLQLLSKIFIDGDFCHNYFHTIYVFARLL